VIKSRFAWLAILISLQIFAGGWNVETLTLADQFTPKFKDTYVYSVSGSCNAPSIPMRKLRDFINLEKIKSDYFEKGHLEVFLGLQKEKSRKTKKAPLTVIIPGAFNKRTSQQSRRFIKFFKDRGHHTLVLPNPWSTDYIACKPFHKPGHIRKEIASVYQVIRSVVLDLKKKNVLGGEVQVVGVSYGAFLTAAAYGLDKEHSDPILNGDATMFSPPYNLANTLEQFSFMQRTTEDVIHEMSLWSLLRYGKKFCSLKSDDELEPLDFHVAMGLSIFGGFQWNLVDAVYLYDKVWKINKVPSKIPFGLNPAYKKWKKELSFLSYLYDYAPENIPILNSETSSILYWMDKARTRNASRMRILISNDDFLNGPGDWQINKGLLKDQSDLIILESGGHYGFRSDAWFQKLMNISFPAKN
jgi:hypothetical protein